VAEQHTTAIPCRRDSLAQAALDLFFAQRPGVQVLLEQRIVAFAAASSAGPGTARPASPCPRHGHLAAFPVARDKRLEVQQVDDASKLQPRRRWAGEAERARGECLRIAATAP